MHISKINIENFRLFKEFSVDLNPGLNVLVGENNSGKTAVIDAIRLTLDTNSAEWTRISENDFHIDTVHISVQLKFENITPEHAHVFVEHLTHEEVEKGSRKSVFYVNLESHLTDNLYRGNRFIRTELRSGANAEGPIIERDIRQYLSATYLKPLRDAEKELSAGRLSRLSQILSSSKEVRKTDHFKELLSDFIEASQKTSKNPGIETSRTAIEKHFQKLTFEDDKEKFELAIQVLGSKDFDQLSEQEQLRAFQDILARLSLTIDQRIPLQGLGYNNILFMATELILLEQEAGQCPILLIEEPEAHLHPQLQMKLLKFIHEEFSNETSPRLQTILTTHSPNLASKAPLNSIILMKDGAAYPMRKDATKLDPDDYVFLEKFLDVTKTNLFFAKAVLIVEGEAESILLPAFAALLGRPLENYGVSVVNVGGTSYARYAKIFLRAGTDDKPDKWLPIPVACIRDLDLWPEKADQELYPDIGFKQVTPGNRPFWETRTDAKGELLGTDPCRKIMLLQQFAEHDDSVSEFIPQNVKVCVSEKWTFEYCLALSPLAPLVYEALQGSDSGFDELSTDEEERAVQIYDQIENKKGGKTEVAYQLVKLLKQKFNDSGKRDELKNSLPPYIIDALKHVSGPWPENLDVAGTDTDSPEVT